MAGGTSDGEIEPARAAPRKRSVPTTWVIAAVIAAIFVFSLSAIVGLRPTIRARLTSDLSEAWFWGGLPVMIAGAAWLVFVVVYRIGVRVEPTLPLPTPGRSRTFGAASVSAAIVVGLAMWIYISMFPLPGRRFRRRVRRGDYLAEEFPDLVAAILAAVPLVLALVLVMWLAFAVARPWLTYLRHRADPARVDGVHDLRGANSVRLLYRPTIGLGAPMRVHIGSRDPFTIVPGQAVGILARSGDLTLRLQGRRTRIKDSVTIALTLAEGGGTQIVLNDGLFRRVKVAAVTGETRFVPVARPFVSMWSGLAYAGLKAQREPGNTVVHDEAEAPGPPGDA